jgi:transmembrane sensor
MDEKYPLADWLDNRLDDDTLSSSIKDDIETYRKIKEYSSRLQAASFDGEAMLQSIMSHTQDEIQKEVPVRTISFSFVTKIAAVMIISLGLGWYFFFKSDIIEINTEQKTASFFLPDSSEVILNSGSSATFNEDEWQSKRKIALKGEGYFKVAKGQKFEVSTSVGSVTVLGTQFNVKALKNRFEVWCYEGKVQVIYNNLTKIITADQAVIFENGLLVDTPIPLNKSPDWLNNKMRFIKSTLPQIVSELESKYNIKINNEYKKSSTFTGVLPVNDWYQVCDILEHTFSIKIIKKKENNYTITSIEKP